MASFTEMVALVKDFLFEEAAALLDNAPDPVMDYSSQPYVNRLREEALVDRFWNAELDHREAVLAKARELYVEYSTNAERLALGQALRLSAKDPLRDWALRQLERAEGKTSTQATVAKVFVYLSLKQVVQWNMDHLPERGPQSALERVQAEWVAKQSPEDPREVTYLDEAGDLQTVKVVDSPSRASYDPRGWDRPSFARVVRPEAKRKAKPVQKWRKTYRDQDTGAEYVQSQAGWFDARGERCWTALEQQLRQRRASGKLVAVTAE